MDGPETNLAPDRDLRLTEGIGVPGPGTRPRWKTGSRQSMTGRRPREKSSHDERGPLRGVRRTSYRPLQGERRPDWRAFRLPPGAVPRPVVRAGSAIDPPAVSRRQARLRRPLRLRGLRPPGRGTEPPLDPGVLEEARGVTGTRSGGHVIGVQRLPARGADDPRACPGTAEVVSRGPRWPIPAGHPPVAPGVDGGQHAEEVPALLREHVFVVDRVGLVGPLLQQTGVDQPSQAIREGVPCDAQRPGEPVETGLAVEDLPEDEQRPAVAEQVGRAGDRARPGLERRASVRCVS
jgi:hypothetical protein